ncbi:FAD binding domain-containing protein (plasmid) [Burkholderia sp. M6-3]
MDPFEFYCATSTAEALRLGDSSQSMFLAGGTELLNWMRIGITRPTRIVDIGRLEGLSVIQQTPTGGVNIGALCKLNDIAENDLIARQYPVLSQAILKAASAQIRNLATIGGNPLQRVRCPYFRAEEPTPCNKRNPGSGCAAVHGYNEKHAIFGWTEDCVAVQPSDPAVALAALDAVYITERPGGGRRLPARNFHVLPTENPSAHNRLGAGELIIAVEIPKPSPQSAYLKIRERESYEYATVSAAVALELDGDQITAARIALGSVAMRPWRLDATEKLLIGQQLGSDEIVNAVNAGFANARALSRNGYKVAIARNAVLRTIETAART